MEPFGGVGSSRPTGAIFSPDGRWVAYSIRHETAGARSAAVRVLDRIATGRPAPQRTLEDIGAATKESKLRERSPEKFAELVQDMTTKGVDELDVPIDKVERYLQERGEDERTLSTLWTGDPPACADGQRERVQRRVRGWLRASRDSGDAHQPTARLDQWLRRATAEDHPA